MVWWLMLAKDKERGERKRTSRDRGDRGWQERNKQKDRQRQRGQRGRQQRNREKRNRQKKNRQRQTDKQTGNKKKTERWGKGETDGGSQRTSCYVVKTDHFTNFGIICTGAFDCAELKLYNISARIMCM
jgi:hypothetical protein